MLRVLPRCATLAREMMRRSLLVGLLLASVSLGCAVPVESSVATGEENAAARKKAARARIRSLEELRTLSRDDLRGPLPDAVGHVVEFPDYPNNFHFAASDGRKTPFRCDRIVGVSNLTRDQCIELESRGGRLCSKVYLNDENGRPLIHANQHLSLPVLTVREWYGVNQFDVVINGNWFLAREYRYFSYRYPCSYPKGIHVANGIVLAEPDVPDRRRGGSASIFDALAVRATCDGHHLEILTTPTRSDMQPFLHAVAGFRLLAHGVVSERKEEASNNPTERKARTGVGMNGTTAWFVVVQPGPGAPGGVTAEEFAQIFLRLGASDAINLDNGGSSQLYFRDPESFDVVESLPGDVIPNDAEALRRLLPDGEPASWSGGNHPVYRPVPNVFGAYRINNP